MNQHALAKVIGDGHLQKHIRRCHGIARHRPAAAPRAPG
jgi:DNA-binding transcriptional MocR family regulator